MKKGDQAAIVCCSDGRPKTEEKEANIQKLSNTLQNLGLEPKFSEYIYEKESVFAAPGAQRAESLMKFYRDDNIRVIFDISGGNVANEILPYLDYDLIAGSQKLFWGYSDLTTVINAIFAKTKKPSVLYQIRHLLCGNSKEKTRDFADAIFNGGLRLFSFQYEWVQKEQMQGIVVGGNIRCLLKLAGTEYWPNMEQKILLLESLRGNVGEMASFLCQLGQMGVFRQINGMLLGTFTEMEETQSQPDIQELVKRFAGKDIPIAKTKEIGHGADAKGIVIGRKICLN